MCFLLHEIIFDIKDAKDAGFINKGKWLNHNMLSYFHIIYFKSYRLKLYSQSPQTAVKKAANGIANDGLLAVERAQTATRKTAYYQYKGLF